MGLLLILQLVSPFRGWMILLVGLTSFWLLSYLWSLSLAHSLRLTREIRLGWVQVGDDVQTQKIQEWFKIDNRGWFPALWIEFVDYSDVPGYNGNRATNVGPRGLTCWEKENTCSRRGLYTLGPATLVSGDPFGLYTATFHFSESTQLLVPPSIIPLPDVQVSLGNRADMGRPRTNAFEHDISVSNVREYSPGDNPRWIHWPTSARQNELYVRNFDSLSTGGLWVLLDADKDIQHGEGEETSLEYGVILAASLADQSLRQGQKVGLIMHGEALVWLEQNEGSNHHWDMLRELAAISTGSCTISRLLNVSGNSFEPATSLIIITPNTNPAWVESLILLIHREITPTVLLLDPQSFGSDTNMDAVSAKLRKFGISHQVIPREMLQLPKSHRRVSGQWSWRILSPGSRAETRHAPSLGWKTTL